MIVQYVDSIYADQVTLSSGQVGQDASTLDAVARLKVVRVVPVLWRTFWYQRFMHGESHSIAF